MSVKETNDEVFIAPVLGVIPEGISSSDKGVDQKIQGIALTSPAFSSSDPSPIMAPRTFKFEERSIFKAKEAEDLDTLTKTKDIFAKRYSKEAGDAPTLHDSLYNYIPGSCFETGVALSLLEQPGLAGKYVDKYTDKLADMIERVYNTDFGNTIITVGKRECTLKDFFNERILKELRPDSDQIGRYMRKDKEDTITDQDFMGGMGKEWLIHQLKMPSDDKNYTYANMLTKLRCINAFAGIVRDASTHNKCIAMLVGKTPQELSARCSSIKAHLRHEGFDNPATRARSERKPLVTANVAGLELKEASDYGLGFGKVYVGDSFSSPEHREAFDKELKQYGQNGIPRRGQVIKDISRPGILTEHAMTQIPDSFKEAGLLQLFEGKKYPHGTGVNRWQLLGSYPRESWDNDMPAAGAHSGGTVDMIMALNSISEDSILQNPKELMPVGLLISSFMNFGGYHSFVETFPVVQAAMSDKPFDVKVGLPQKENLYKSFKKAAEDYAAPPVYKQIEAFYAAYEEMG